MLSVRAQRYSTSSFTLCSFSLKSCGTALSYIKEMYLRIEITSKDGPFHRFSRYLGKQCLQFCSNVLIRIPICLWSRCIFTNMDKVPVSLQPRKQESRRLALWMSLVWNWWVPFAALSWPRRLPNTVGQTVKTCFGGHVPQVEDLCHSSPTELPKFKGQRSSKQWRYISTDDNPAILELRIWQQQNWLTLRPSGKAEIRRRCGV